MHQSLINNLNHMFLNKNLPRLFEFAKYVGPLRMNIDREALEGIFGFFRWLINLWFILLTPSTFYYYQNLLSVQPY
jgi:hypothetical protein